MRHFPYRIGTTERDQWLLCMHRALDEQVADPSCAPPCAAPSTAWPSTINHAEAPADAAAPQTADARRLTRRGAEASDDTAADEQGRR